MRVRFACAAVVGGALLLGCAQADKSQPQQQNELAGVDTPPMRQEYVGPTAVLISQTATIAGSRVEVWEKVLANLQGRGLTIEHSDPATGSIIARYSGDPEPYVDCGMIAHKVAGGTGNTFEEYPAARQRVAYNQRSDTNAFPILREMSLDGRVVVNVGGGGSAKMTRSGNIRAEPDRGAARLTTLPAGAPVMLLGDSGKPGWYRVKLDDGRTGYVADFLVGNPRNTDSGEVTVSVDAIYVITRTMTVGGAAAQKTRETISFPTGGNQRFGTSTQCVAKGTLEQIALQP